MLEVHGPILNGDLVPNLKILGEIAVTMKWIQVLGDRKILYVNQILKYKFQFVTVFYLIKGQKNQNKDYIWQSKSYRILAEMGVKVN